MHIMTPGIIFVVIIFNVASNKLLMGALHIYSDLHDAVTL